MPNQERLLVLLRHAKAVAHDATPKDFDRPLSERGLRDAVAIGKKLKARGLAPDLVASSPAPRALATALLVADELKYGHKHLVQVEALFDASRRTFLSVISKLPDTARTVVLAGHNPAISELVGYLSHHDLFEGMPTGSAAAIRFEGLAWREITQSAGEFQWFEEPGA